MVSLLLICPHENEDEVNVKSFVSTAPMKMATAFVNTESHDSITIVSPWTFVPNVATILSVAIKLKICVFINCCLPDGISALPGGLCRVGRNGIWTTFPVTRGSDQKKFIAARCRVCSKHHISRNNITCDFQTRIKHPSCCILGPTPPYSVITEAPSKWFVPRLVFNGAYCIAFKAFANPLIPQIASQDIGQ